MKENGKGVEAPIFTERVRETEGDTTEGWGPEEFNEVIKEHLPDNLAIKIKRVVNEVGGNYWDVWPELDDMDIGIIMMAGAVNF